jgi:hypothetical protein
LIYEKQLKPVMYDIGDLWAQGKIDSATEHEISNYLMYLFNTQHIISHNLARPATHVQHSSKNDVSYFDGGLFLSSFQIYEH